MFNLFFGGHKKGNERRNILQLKKEVDTKNLKNLYGKLNFLIKTTELYSFLEVQGIVGKAPFKILV